MRWLDEEKTGQIFILVPTTPVTRKAIGFSSTQCASKFLGSITSEFLDAITIGILCWAENGICCQQETNVS